MTEEALEFLHSRLRAYADIVPPEGLDEINKWLHHDEYEMAFEGLALELMALGIEPDEAEAADWLRHGRALGLEAESMLDRDFARKLRRWTAR
jgi:hypothetical protein